MVDTVRDLLADSEKGRLRAQSVLSWIFRDVLVHRRVNIFTWNKRIQQFFDKPHNRENKPDRGNLNKTLTNDEFTWEAFKKAVDFLNPKHATFHVKLFWRNGRESEYSLTFAFDKEDDVIEGLPPDTRRKKKDKRSTLARLYARILNGEQVDPRRWDALLDAWVKKPENGIIQTRVHMLRERTERQREILRPKMTWRVFRIGLLLLDPERVEFRLVLKWPDTTTAHAIDLPMS